ncbi:MAG: hypothetical protein JRN42_05430, partial [Nitrososphaerota archaeon]|nr:hypothetical protein [Nitrososphaerota archaeon]
MHPRQQARSTRGSRRAIVCDFDGTALALDLGDAVALRFAGAAAYAEAEERFRAGQSSFGVLLQ